MSGHKQQQSQLRFDEADVVQVQINFDGFTVGELQVPARELTIPTANVEKVKALVADLYNAGTALQSRTDDLAELQGKHDALIDEHKVLKEKVEKADSGKGEELQAAVKIRLGLEKTATFLKVDKVDTMDDAALMGACILKKYGDKVKLDDKSPEYIQARYDLIAEEAVDGMKGFEQLAALSVTQTPRLDNLQNFTAGGGDDLKSQREKFMSESSTAFKDPQGKKTKQAQQAS